MIVLSHHNLAGHQLKPLPKRITEGVGKGFNVPENLQKLMLRNFQPFYVILPEHDVMLEGEVLHVAVDARQLAVLEDRQSDV